MSVIANRSARALAVALGVALVGAIAGAPTAATAAPSVRTAAAAAAIDPDLLGSSALTAAGSCWEIKQERPSAASGAYWLLTPAMPEPQRFYCDQTTDGGGWVLVGKGRNGWTVDDAGRGSAAALLSPSYAGGSDVHQYPTSLVDQLVGGARTIDLPDGVRVRRALNQAGTAWQEVRFHPDTRQTGWTWAWEAKIDPTTWSFAPESPSGGTASGSGGTTDNFGAGTSWARMRYTSAAVTGWTNGWSYGDGVTGTSANSSHLWTPTDGGARATPVAQVYLRPKVSSDDADFTQVPDSGTPKRLVRAVPKSDADPLPWGVSGLAGSTTREGSVEVQELLVAHGRMYVGGNFRYVQRDAAGTGRVEQPFLAAFNLATGEWISSFRPDLNEQVRALELSTTGAIIAAGDFTSANGARASAIVALDPDTGATDTSFKLTIENRLTGGLLRVWALDRIGNQLYIGGDFTHLKGGSSGAFAYMRALARVRLTDGLTPGNWNPEMNGAVTALDVSDDGKRVYAAGFFTTSRGVAARRAAAVLTTFITRSNGTIQHLATPTWSPTWSSSNDYQQAVVEARGNVWVGGAEHAIFGFNRSTFERMSSTILHLKGDVQTMAVNGNVLFAGSHANNQFAYTGATTWSGSGGAGGAPWTSVHSQHWVGAYDATNGAALADFAPSLQMRIGAGVWATAVDGAGRLWVGGDIAVARTTAGPRFSGGFARFSPRDATAPSTPGSFRVVDSTSSQVTLSWAKVSDASGVRYQVLRGDRPIATTTQNRITLPVGGSAGAQERYFVRAADGAGNISASTAVLRSRVPSTAALIPSDAEWTWRYATTPPSTSWKARSFNDSSWSQGGTAPLGFGAGPLGTDIDTFATTAERPLAAYFRRKFQVADPDEILYLEVSGVADDGAVFYVNGTEFARSNLPTGTITSGTFASTARARSVAEANPVVFRVPASRLYPGDNLITVETHLNYKATPDLTFHLTMDAVLAS